MNKICFLGTGGDSSVIGRQMLGSGGIVIQHGQMQFHIDPGPGSLPALKTCGLTPRATTCVLASHHHLNHAGDIHAVVAAMTLSGMDKKGVIAASKSTVEKIEPFFKSCVERVIQLEGRCRIGIEDAEIYAFPVRHDDQSALGFRVELPGYILGYTGDTAYDITMVEDLAGSHVLILNIVAPRDTKISHQLNSDDAIKIIEKVKPKLAIITHFGIQMLKADPLEEARHIQRKTNVQTIAAKDGLQLTPSVYQAQASLKK